MIAELYAHVVEALWAAESFLTPTEWPGEPSKLEKHETAMRELVTLYRYFDRHRIYLPAEICVSFEKLVEVTREHIIRFGVYVVHMKDASSEHAALESNDAWDRGWRAIKEQIPPARERLERELRGLLGGPEAIS